MSREAAEKALAGMTAIVKRRYETGEYGNAHFKVSADLLDVIREQAPPPRPNPFPHGWLSGDPLGDLLAIPFALDDQIPPGTWRLVENGTGRIIDGGGP